MSKGRRGNKEAKKPKRAQAAATPVLPQLIVATPLGVTVAPQKKK